MRNIHSQESGRSMIEMLGVLAIVGVLSVGGIAGYTQAMNKFKVTKATDQIQTLFQNIRTLTASQRNMDLVNTPTLMHKLGALTDEMCQTSTCTSSNMVNPYGGSILMGTYDGSAKKKIYITYNDLPSSACVSLATQSWGDSASGLDAIEVKNAAAAAYSATVYPTSSTAAGDFVMNTKTDENPISLSDASTGCGDTGTSSITFFLR